LTLCTGEGARFRASPKKLIMTKFATLEFLIFNFLSAIYCIATIEAVLSATNDHAKVSMEVSPEQDKAPPGAKCRPT
jgi:hypothetical protein